MKAVILYWSQSGNTQKVAEAIRAGLELGDAIVHIERIDEHTDVDLFGYDLVCLGFPSYQWAPPTPVIDYLKRMYQGYRRQGYVKVGAPVVSGKRAVVFCTYSGPHTGINEAIPAGKYAGQFFEHLGIPVVDEWYVIGEYHGSEVSSTQGRLGDIRGRPNAEDLEDITQRAYRLTGH